ncbi:sulfite exporter TauE/SafE family protein [Halococcoides cellulosivorans]|uniref:Urease accessory protein UreH-like transmembrane domain-containing protein n=1 Tax=Halococcoides cellulosivorans TaxID=1679096 RepID=A0A2R4X0Z5_9EURY|nr:sulfite exporter TauE/SafE family protein [Halococcoides cellulosivorans]AWB27468.1 hypothetical protein HARCEL1_06985 [Halococcoides cellulosivorans]
MAVFDLAVFAAIGLFGGAHCIGMCGPLATTYGDRVQRDAGPPTWFAIRQHTLYNLGRTLSYTVVGALLATIGALVYGAADLAAIGTLVRGVVGVVVGVLIVALGLARLRGGGGATLFPEGPGGRLFATVTQRVSRHVDRLVEGPGIVALGALHAILPCPLLYPAYAYAAASGDPIAGASALAALGLGTIPAMFLVGTTAGAISGARRRTIDRALGAIFVVLGFVPLLMGLATLGVPVPTIPIPHAMPLS